VILLLALPTVFQGCSTPTAPQPPPGGGQVLTLSYDEFVLSVEPILVRQGCDATGDCHGGGIRGTLALSPPGAKDPRFDFDQVSLEVLAAMPDSSPILTRPLALAAGGTPHSYKPFATTIDTDYQAIRTWIMNGVNR
jgi:hypothetical protein